MLLIHTGKVRDLYTNPDDPEHLYLVASDRLSAFDRQICDVPGKGQALTQISAYWFRLLEKQGIPTHFKSLENEQTMKVIKTTPIPLEFVVRGYLTGNTSTSIWTHYAQGERVYCGHALPDGMVRNQALATPILTPTTKDTDHDQPVSRDDIVEKEKILTAELYDALEDTCLKMFALGQEKAAKAGLILADTKYEFGFDKGGKLMLIDEVHTPDSSRFWEAASYQEAMAARVDPKPLDKDMIRAYVKERCDPYNDPLPPIPSFLIDQTSHVYATFLGRLLSNAKD